MSVYLQRTNKPTFVEPMNEPAQRGFTRELDQLLDQAP